MKTTFAVVFSVVMVVCVCVVIVERREINRLRNYARELEQSRRTLLEEMYGFSHVVPDAKTMATIESVYADIIVAYTNENLLAMRKGIARLPRVHAQLMSPIADKVERSFVSALNASFLLATHLRDFSTVDEFDRYVQVSLAAARFHGETALVRKTGDLFPAGVEYLALSVLHKYRQKFKDEKRIDLEKSAKRHLEFWIARIESADGLTRQCAWQTMKRNTVYNKVVLPGRELTEAQGIRLARQVVNGLIRCGYTPKWLDEDFPLPEGI